MALPQGPPPIWPPRRWEGTMRHKGETHMVRSLLALCLIGALAAGCAAMLGTQGRTATGSSTTAVQNVPRPPGTPTPRAQNARRRTATGSSTTAVQNVPWPPGTPIPRAQYARLTWTSPGVTEEVRIQRRDGTDLAAPWVDLGGIRAGCHHHEGRGALRGAVLLLSGEGYDQPVGNARGVQLLDPTDHRTALDGDLSFRRAASPHPRRSPDT